MGPDEHTGNEILILDAHGGADADPVGHGTVLFHFHAGIVQQRDAAHGTFHTGKGLIGPDRETLVSLDQGREEASKDPHFAVYIGPADFSLGDDPVPFFLGEIGDMLPDDSQGIFVGVGKFHGGSHHHLPMDQHTVTQGIGNFLGLQAVVNEADGIVVGTVVFQTEDVLRQAYILKLKSIVDIHTDLLIIRNSPPRKSGAGSCK